jgi:hypothetical protein
MSKFLRRLCPSLLMAFALCAAWLFLQTAAVQADDTAPNSDTCLACHGKPGMIKVLPNGEQLYLSVDGQDYKDSVHAHEKNMDCVACHKDNATYPHPAKTFTTLREYTLLYKDSCNECHKDQVKPEGMHQQIMAKGVTNAPTCADCHNPHTQPKLTDANGQVTFLKKAQIAQTCARCHSAIYAEYASSVHGAAAIGENNPDVPVCITCHGAHEVTDPRTNKFRLASPEMCGKCHTDKPLMAKYKLSTDVYNTYVSDFHGTTVTMFEKSSPEQQTNKPVCYDCHGVHNIVSPKDPQSGIAVRQNLLKTCQKCHPDANLSFPDSWTSHYVPSASKNSLVYYVNLFYAFFIPGVLGAMGVFVLSDIFRRVRSLFVKPGAGPKEH